MKVAGDPADLALSGWDGADGTGPVFALGGDGDVVLHERDDGSTGSRVVAPAGEGPWRRMPWPANDALFDLPAPAERGSVLVVGDGDEAGEVAGALAAHDLTVASAERLTVDALGEAAVVVLLGGHGALHAHAFPVLAARRILIADATDVAFGLQPGIEFLLTRFAGEAVERARMACLHPRAFASLPVLGAAAARRHRASVVYPRLAWDLAT